MNPVDVVPLDARQAALLHCRYARSWRNPEPGEGAGQLGTSTEPSGDLQWLPEAALAWWCVGDRPADRARVEVLADAPELLARLRGDPRHRIDDRVPQAEGAHRRRGAQPGGVWGDTLAAAPNNTVNRLVCTASAESLACCAVLPPPETTIAWTARGR